MIRISAATFGLIAALLLAGSTPTGGSELLVNGGFEQGSSGWSYLGGDFSELNAVGAPVHGGSRSGRFSGSGQPTTQVAYQFVDVQPGQSYELSGWVAASGGAVSAVFLRISWFDGSGQTVLQDDSLGLAQRDGNFYPLTTGPRASPAAARSARTSLYVLGNPQSPFEVHLDDFAFSGPAAVPPPPPPITTPPPTSPPPAVTPTPQPPIATPTRTPRRTTTPVRTSAPQPTDDAAGGAPTTPGAEAEFFNQLVNGGFEEIRPDGTPYGWRKQGGEMATVGEPRTEGSRAATLLSQTTSTKWLHQTVIVRGDAHYEASVDALAIAGSESVFLRLSWYASADGSGAAIDSVDSLEASSPTDASFVRLTTGVVAAPPEAGSAKVRLMLRPASGETATAYFDSTMLIETTAGVQTAAGRTSGGAVSAAGRRVGSGGNAEPLGGAGPGLEGQPAGATPVRLTNVKPPQVDGASPPGAAGGGGDDWAILLALVIAVAAIGIAGGYEFWQRRRGRDVEAGEI